LYHKLFLNGRDSQKSRKDDELIKRADREIIVVMKDIHERILREPLISRVLGTGMRVYLVGGYLRDVLRGARSKDIDFVVKGDPESILKKIAPDQGGSVVKFSKAPLVRVVTGEYTLDFTELKGTIEEDLSKRDFTVNALAWSEEEGIIDPFHGFSDIRGKKIRAVTEDNFLDDPLRLVRAYRFSGELGWEIEEGTRKSIRKLKGLIRQPATERITLEIFRLLNSTDTDSCLNALKMAERDGILGEIIYMKNNKLLTNIKAISRFNAFLNKVPQEYRVFLDKPFSQGLSYRGLLKAELLLSGSSLERNRLSLSRPICKRLRITSGLLKELDENKKMNNRRVFDLFARAGGAIGDFAFLTMRRDLLMRAEKFMAIKPVLTAERIMEITRLGPGPELGNVLAELKRLLFLGEIKNETDAVAWLAGRF
jgi:tRNA nucleotidyltransferase/poly(A) polymerase